VHWVDYATLLGLNPYHPDTWSAEGRAEMQRWQLERFRARWRWLQAQDHPALVRAQCGRTALLDMVREDLAYALRPFRSRPYILCPCHPARLGMPPPGPDPWLEDRSPGVPAAELALRWLHATFGPQKERT
jgi:hypothetical protein